MTAYEMRISDWSSDVCSSDLHRIIAHKHIALPSDAAYGQSNCALGSLFSQPADGNVKTAGYLAAVRIVRRSLAQAGQRLLRVAEELRSEEHTSELQSLMRNSYAVFCLKKKRRTK